ncbi:hypothetical protein [Phyllobacterium myrsinacearum]|uniref:Flagellar biosynthesis protein FliR n=1 Tax=Phyllobacterium myrsinacearum TaxID=28101 RepID=A0A839EUG3_9HYPH|nr:hypothetical protein [Phyllobacterium myrsinacearum]MBA8881745.1 flagellar biosynthesis protein FliR [Phyllobacterium myrsinacearum]
MSQGLPPKTSRTFTKRMLIANVILCWAEIFFGTYMGATEGVIVAAFGLIGICFSAYMGVGHFDFRRATDFITSMTNASQSDEVEPKE